MERHHWCQQFYIDKPDLVYLPFKTSIYKNSCARNFQDSCGFLTSQVTRAALLGVSVPSLCTSRGLGFVLNFPQRSEIVTSPCFAHLCNAHINLHPISCWLQAFLQKITDLLLKCSLSASVFPELQLAPQEQNILLLPFSTATTKEADLRSWPEAIRKISAVFYGTGFCKVTHQPWKF